MVLCQPLTLKAGQKPVVRTVTERSRGVDLLLWRCHVSKACCFSRASCRSVTMPSIYALTRPVSDTHCNVNNLGLVLGQMAVVRTPTDVPRGEDLPFWRCQVSKTRCLLPAICRSVTVPSICPHTQQALFILWTWPVICSHGRMIIASWQCCMHVSQRL